MLIQLNDQWRVIEHDAAPRQWILQRIQGKQWINQSYCVTRAGLLTAIKEKITDAVRFYQGGKTRPVDSGALGAVEAFHVGYPGLCLPPFPTAIMPRRPRSKGKAKPASSKSAALSPKPQEPARPCLTIYCPPGSVVSVAPTRSRPR